MRDASEDRPTKAFWTARVVGAEVAEVKIIPLYGHLYSQSSPGFISEFGESSAIPFFEIPMASMFNVGKVWNGRNVGIRL